MTTLKAFYIALRQGRLREFLQFLLYSDEQQYDELQAYCAEEAYYIDALSTRKQRTSAIFYINF